MSDPVIVTLIIRGVLALMLATVGAWVVYLGYRLLFAKTPHRSNSAFEATFGGHQVSFSAGTAGTAVVFTSAIWVIGAVLTVPVLEQASGTTVALGPEVTNTTGVESVAAIEFKGDRVSLTSKQKEALESFASYIETIENYPNIVVEGYADVGPSELSGKVAEQRAEAVRNYMVKFHKIDRSQIRTFSYRVSKTAFEANKNAVVLTATTSNEDG